MHTTKLYLAAVCMQEVHTKPVAVKVIAGRDIKLSLNGIFDIVAVSVILSGDNIIQLSCDRIKQLGLFNRGAVPVIGCEKIKGDMR